MSFRAGAGAVPDGVPDDTVDSDKNLPGPRPVPVFTQPNSLSFLALAIKSWFFSLEEGEEWVIHYSK